MVFDHRPASCAELANWLAPHHEVETTSAEETARQMIAFTAPDGVVLGAKALDEAVLAVCRGLKADPKTAEVFVILVAAAFSDGLMRVKGLEAGADVCLCEPVCPEELQAHARRLMRQRKRRESARTETLAEVNQRLRQSEERLKLALTASNAGVWERDLRTETVFWSPECYAITGAENFDGTIESFLRELHPEDVPRVKAAAEKMVKQGDDYSVEFRMLRADGQMRWVSSVGRPQFDGTGAPVRVVGTVRDITQSKQAAGVHQLTQFSVDNASEGISWVGLDAHFKFVNDAGCRLLGYSREELLQMTVHQIDPNRPPAAWAEDCEHLKRVKAVTFETNMLRKDGSFVPVELTVNYVAFEGVEYSCAFWRDITLRKQAEASLLKDLERGRMLLELYKNSAELSELALYNFALEQVTRLTDSSIGFLHRLSPDQKTIMLTTWTQASRSGCQVSSPTHYPIESAGIWADCVRLHRPIIYNEVGLNANSNGFPAGHVQVRRFMSIPVNVGQQVRLVFGVGNKPEKYTERDIVQIQLVANELEKILTQRRAEENVRQSHEQLQALTGRLQAVREEERTHLAREIHDVLAQELTCLKMEIVSVKSRLDRPGEASPEQLRQRLEGMNRAVNRAVESVQKIATELRPVILDTLGLSAAIEWLMQDFEARTGIQCETNVPAKPLALNRDQSTALFRILQESLTNVMRHAGAAKVEVRLTRRSRQVTLRVRDNGRGMEPSCLSDPRSIGLVGMRERALLLQGECLISSRPGSGTTVEVRFNLPSTQAAAPKSSLAAAS